MIGMIGLRQCVAKRHKGGAAPSPQSPQPPNNLCTHLQPNNCCYCGAFVGFQYQNAADSVRMIGLSFKTLQTPYKSIFFFQRTISKPSALFRTTGSLKHTTNKNPTCRSVHMHGYAGVLTGHYGHQSQQDTG